MGHYFAAYIIPLSAAIGLWAGGAWSWLAVGLVYGVVPLLDQAVGRSAANLDDTAQAAAARSRTADGALYLALHVQCGLLLLLAVVWQGEAGLLERVGWIASTALSCGGLGIVIGHELVHRRDRTLYWLGKSLLGTVLYTHFAVEHVRGHHARVGTDADPASARQGQSVYAFIPRSIIRQFLSAWDLETRRLARAGQGAWTLRNEVLVGWGATGGLARGHRRGVRPLGDGGDDRRLGVGGHAARGRQLHRTLLIAALSGAGLTARAGARKPLVEQLPPRQPSPALRAAAPHGSPHERR